MSKWKIILTTLSVLGTIFVVCHLVFDFQIPKFILLPVLIFVLIINSINLYFNVIKE